MQALSRTSGVVNTSLEVKVARSIKGQAHLPHDPATLGSGISHKYFDVFPNTYAYKCSLHCLNSERLEANVYQQGNGLKFMASLNYKTLFSG